MELTVLFAGSSRIVERRYFRPLALLCSMFSVPLAHAVTCGSLSQLKLPDTTITLAKAETAETYKHGKMEASGPPLINLPAFCQVAGEIRPTPDWVFFD
jgi:feruloyl esterase